MPSLSSGWQWAGDSSEGLLKDPSAFPCTACLKPKTLVSLVFKSLALRRLNSLNHYPQPETPATQQEESYIPDTQRDATPPLDWILTTLRKTRHCIRRQGELSIFCLQTFFQSPARISIIISPLSYPQSSA